MKLRLGPKVIRYFKQSGDGWQTRLNETPEEHVAGTPREHSRSMPRSIAGVYAMANEQTGKKAGKAARRLCGAAVPERARKPLLHLR